MIFSLDAPWRVLGKMLVAAMLCLIAVPVFAQILPGEPTEEAVDAPVREADAYGRETPRSTVTGLLDAMGADDFDRAAHYFEFIRDAAVQVVPLSETEIDAAEDEASTEVDTKRQQQLVQGAALARKLKAALDKGGTLVPFAALSNLPTGTVSDGLEPTIEEVGSLGSGEGQIAITLERALLADGRHLWRISPATARAIEDFIDEVPEVVQADEPALTVAGAPFFDWVKLLGVALASFLFFRLVSGLILKLLRRFLPDYETSAVYRLLYAGLPPLALYLAVLTFYITADTLAVAIVARQTLLRYAGIVAWIALAWFALRLVDGVAKFFAARMHRAERRQAVSVITFIRRGAKFFVLAIAAVAVLDTIGLDVTTGLAALGIGGIALALGAQKTIENLVGSITVIADKPVQVGDVAKIGDVFGTVEDIGMRSTRVRTNERTVVTIPNGDLASQRIENFALRDRFLFHQTLGVSYDTSAEQMEQVLEAIRDIIGAADNIIDDDARVRFHGFGDSSLDIEIFAYFRTRTYPSSLAMQEELLLAIMRKLHEMNVEIAFPTRTINLRAETNFQ